MRQLGPGDEIGGYRIEGLAGRGGMGLVYRARQRRPDRIVAIKVIAPELVADPEFRARFEQESATAAEIEHPNVIPVYEVGEDHGQLFISMRFVQGVDLGRLLMQEGRLDPARAAHLIAQVADALDAAHARGLVHRDVKPGNILVAGGDHVYLTDFGLTKRTTDTQTRTRAGMFVGTVDYIAPEQVEGRRVDARADVYALGCVSYEALTGHVPFQRDSDLAKIFAHVNDPPPRLEGVPPPLADAVERAMAKRPEDRFLSAGDFGRAVVAGAAGRVVSDSGRTVAVGEAAIAEAHAPTEFAAPTPLPSGRDALTETGSPVPTPRGTPPSPAPSPTPAPAPARGGPARRGFLGLGSRPRWVLWTGAGVLVAVVGAGVALAVALGGSSKVVTTTTFVPPNRTSSTTSTAAAATQTKIYDPVNANGDLAVSVTARRKGNCWTTSETAARADAFRCMVGNNIYDPCFQVLASDALCPVNGPWSNSGLLLTGAGPPTGVTPNKDLGTRGPPWAIELADGTKCQEVSGATTLIAGQRLGYACGGGVGLYGDVHRSGTTWTIYVGTAHSATLAVKPIAVAWF